MNTATLKSRSGVAQGHKKFTTGTIR